MLEALAAAAWKRPWALLTAAAVAAGVLIAFAGGAADELGHPRTAEATGVPDAVIAADAETRVGSQVSSVAVEAIAAKLEAKPEVASVEIERVKGRSGVAVLEVRLGDSDAAQRRALVDDLAAEVDPGPLQVYVGGRLAELVAAESVIREDIWRLELLVVPLALLALAAVVGVPLAVGPALCAAIAVAGALAGLRIAGALTDLSLLGVVPAAGLGIALGIELPALLAARWEDEVRFGDPGEALRSTLTEGAGAVVFAALAAALAGVGLLASGLDAAASLALGSALAAAAALGACLLVMPALFALDGRRAGEGAQIRADRRLAHALAAAPRWLGRAPRRTVLTTVAATSFAVVLAYPALDGQSRPLDARDLPASAPAVRAAEIAESQPPAGAGGKAAADRADPAVGGEGSLLPELPLAAVLAAALLAVLFVLRSRSWRAIPFALMAMLPAAAACGVVAFAASADGDWIPFAPETPHVLMTGALASALVATAAIAAARSSAALDAVRSERALDPGPAGVAERAGTLTLPAAFLGTLLTAAAAVAGGGIELEAARQLAICLTAGLLVDLLAVRPVMLASMARWQGPRETSQGRGARLRLGCPRWRRTAKELPQQADS